MLVKLFRSSKELGYGGFFFIGIGLGIGYLCLFVDFWIIELFCRMCYGFCFFLLIFCEIEGFFLRILF